MLEFFSILLVQVAQFALASPSHTDPPLDCLSAEQLCLSIQNCLLAWEAHRASCGLTGPECKSLDLESCHSALVGLQTSAPFNRTCLCLKNMGASKYNQCRDVRQRVFYHPCIPVIKDKFYELYYSSPKSERTNENEQPHDRQRAQHQQQQHHIRHQQRKLQNGDLQHPQRSNNGVNHGDKKTSREIMQKQTDVLPRPVGPTYPSDEPPHTDSSSVRHVIGHDHENDHDTGGVVPSDRRRSQWNKSQRSCTAAFRRCQRHVACQRLWDLYREKCSVQNYECGMTDRKGCREAYDGIQWTGLNTCHCEDDHSLHGPECHWIELLTSHNKCIDELKKSGYINGNDDNNNGYPGAPATPPIASHPDYDEALETTDSPESRQVTRPDARRPQPSPGYQDGPRYVVTSASPSVDVSYYSSRTYPSSFTAPPPPLSPFSTARIRPVGRPRQQQQLPPESSVTESSRRRGYPSSPPPSRGRESTGEYGDTADGEGTRGGDELYESHERTHVGTQRTVSEHDYYFRTFAPSTMYPPESTLSTVRLTPSGRGRTRHPSVTPGDLPRRRFTVTAATTPSSYYEADPQRRREQSRHPEQYSYRPEERLVTVRSSTHAHAPKHVFTTTVVYDDDDDDNGPEEEYEPPSNGEDDYDEGRDYEIRTARPVVDQRAGLNATPVYSSYVSRPSPHVKVTGVHLRTTGTGRGRVTPKATTKAPSRLVTSSVTPKKTISPLVRRTTTTTSTSTTSTSSTSTTTTTPPPTMPPDAVTMGIPELTKVISEKEVALGNSYYRIDSTCQRAHAECRWDKQCGWSLSEIEIYCGNERDTCNRTLCAGALRRFSDYVKNEALQEAVTFCTCKTNDIDCLRQQKTMFPSCMFTNQGERLKSCKDLVLECKKDSKCSPWADKYFEYCKFDTDSMRCQYESGACRLATRKIRGSPLESDCWCEKGDDECQALQSTMYFRNPCFEEARLSMIPKFTTKKITTSTSTTRSTSTTTTTSTPSTSTTTTTPTTTTKIISTSRKNNYSMSSVLSNRLEEFFNASMITDTRITTPVTTNPGLLPRGNVGRTSKPTDSEEIYAEHQLKPDDTPLETSRTSTTTTTTTTKPTTRRRTTVTRTTTTTTTTSTTTTTTTTTPTTTTPTTTTTTTPTTTTPSIRCRVMDIDGLKRSYVPLTYYRDYLDNDYRCSRYCLCKESLDVDCRKSIDCLPNEGCTVDKEYITSKTVDLYSFGSVNYLVNRGRCTCSVLSNFVCQFPEGFKLSMSTDYFPENGLFLGIGYSQFEYSWLKQRNLPGATFYQAGHWFTIREHLQLELNKLNKMAHERMKMSHLPDNSCKITYINRIFTNYIIYQIEHRDLKNLTETYQTGGPEWLCRKPIKELQEKLNNGWYRDNLILSVVKQVWVQDNVKYTGSASMKKIKRLRPLDIFVLFLLPVILLLQKWCFSTSSNFVGENDALLVNIETFFIEKSCLIVMLFILLECGI